MLKGITWTLLLAACFSASAQQHETVTYVYTDPQGNVLAEADSQGNVKATYDYRPYGSVALGGNTNGPGYSGHVTDPDTTLIYMQARYYDPEIGRFLSIDAAPPKPGDINYVNDYSYVGNNPIMRTDPSGNYICSGNKNQCSTIRRALRNISKASNKLPDGSPGQKKLNDVLSFYGEDGVSNGVSVGFGQAAGNNAVTQTNGKGDTHITFNLTSVNITGSNQGTTPTVEAAATVAHEGQHGIDGQTFGAPMNRAEWRVTELNAFTTQSYVNEGLNVTSPYGLWNNGWTENSITNGLRESSAGFNSDYLVYGRKGSSQ